MTKRAYVKALVGDLRRYLQWQQAQGVIGSSPASEADRAAFEAFREARQERQLAKMRANLSSGSPSTASSRAPERAGSQPGASTFERPSFERPSSGRPAPASQSPSQPQRPSFKEPSAPAPPQAAPTSQNASDAGAPIWAQLGARTLPTFSGGSAAGPDHSSKSPTNASRSDDRRASPGSPGPSKNTSSSPRSSGASAVKSPPVSLNDEPPPYDDYDGPMYDEALSYEDYSHEELLSSPPSSAAPEPTAPKSAAPRAAAKAPAAAPKTPQEKMDFLKNYLGDCQRCTLCKARTRVVIGEGNPSARLMFISDAPGAEEDKAGRPFAGASGALLTKMIQGMGLRREEVYIASVVKCRPPGDRRPAATEVAECLPFLKKQIEVVQPEVIVTLGGFTALALLGDAAKTKGLRGTWQTHEGIALLPTFHPDDLLRDESKKRPAWEDLQKVMKRLG